MQVGGRRLLHTSMQPIDGPCDPRPLVDVERREDLRDAPLGHRLDESQLLGDLTDTVVADDEPRLHRLRALRADRLN